jgi:hypothetical protein
MAAALLGLMVEESGFQPTFTAQSQPAADAIVAHGPVAVLIDYDHPEFNKRLIDVVKTSGARPVLFSPFRSRGEMKELGSRHGTKAIALPAEPEAFALVLTA